MNSLLQQLFMIPLLRKGLFDARIEKPPEDPSAHLLFQLKVFSLLKTHRSCLEFCRSGPDHLSTLQEEMRSAVERLDFERAIEVRDEIARRAKKR